ncbi:hypothetical protein PC121_g18568 [Phytophthora cactorum]|nr:hypothetical protein PC120_g21012 [Phytophthora cactorum]KAG3050109.1 hypothetical protein PC121_g18568 [Phytophthora cactorum]KAG4062009.1 hypothetical protein PC123_g3113 [Phytophthora cactorum]
MYRPSKDENLALLSCLVEYAMECKVTVNGREWNARMSHYIAYVAHIVIIYETLTVTRFQTQLRMRHNHIDEMGLVRVKQVIEELRLSD